MNSRSWRLPILTVLFVLGTVWVYSMLLSHLGRDLLLGSNPNDFRTTLFNDASMLAVPLAVPLTIVSGLTLLLLGVRALMTPAHRSLACPKCGTLENRAAGLKFVHRPLERAGWESITCSRCGYNWHGPR